MIKSAFLIVATCCSLQLFSQEKFPDGKIIPDWFYKNEKTIDVTRELFNERLNTIKDKELKKVIKWHFDYEEYAEEQLMDHYYDTEYGCIYI